MSVTFFNIKGNFIAHSTNGILELLGIPYPEDVSKHKGPFEMTKGEAHPLKNGISFVVISDGSCPINEKKSIDKALQVLSEYGIFPVKEPKYEKDGQWVFLT